MSELKLYAFMGTRDTYQGEPRKLVGFAYQFEDTWYHFGGSDLMEGNFYKLFWEGFAEATASLVHLDTEIKSLLLVSSPTSEAEEPIRMIERLFNTESKYSDVIESLNNNKKMDLTERMSLAGIATVLKNLVDNLVEVSAEYKESKETITGSIQADSAAARAYYAHLQGNQFKATVTTQKDLRGRTKDIPKLITDSIIFNWLPDTKLNLDGQTPHVYYTGNGELENKKPKGVKIDPIIAQSNVYFTGNNKRLRVLGKLSAEDRYNVVILREPAVYLEKVFDYQREICKRLYSTEQMVAYRTREVFGAGVSNYIDDGDFTNLGYSINGDLFTTTTPRKDLSYVFNPPRLAFKIKRELENNQTKLLHHIHGESEKLNIKATDITDYFYNRDEDKCTLRTDLTNKVKELRLKDIVIPVEGGKTVNIKAMMKYDLPERNFFNKLVKDEPKVELLTWMVDDHTVAYACVVTTVEGWLFYHGQYGSRHLLRTVSAKNRKKDK